MRKREEKKRSFSVYKSLMFGNKKTYLYVRKQGYFSMVMPSILLVDKKAVFSLFPQAESKNPHLYTVIHSFLRLSPEVCGKLLNPVPMGKLTKIKLESRWIKAEPCGKKRTYTQFF